MVQGKNGSFEINGSNGFTGRIDWTETYDIASNTSVVSVRMFAKTSRYGISEWYPNGTIKVNGETIVTMNSYDGDHNLYLGYVNNYREILNAEGAADFSATTVIHNADGTKTIPIEVDIALVGYGGVAGNSATISGTQDIALTTIPRKATLVSAPNEFDDESPITVTYSNPAGEVVESLQLCIAENTDSPQTIFVAYRDVLKTGNSYDLTLTEEDKANLWGYTKNSNNGIVAFVLKTTIGGVEYVNVLQNKIFKVVDANPVLELKTVNETNQAVTDLAGTAFWIRYRSCLQVEASYYPQKGAEIKSFTATNGGQVITENPAQFDFITAGTVDLAVEDSRGNISKLSVVRFFTPYVLPTCSLDDAKLDTDGDLTVNISGSFYDGFLGNTENPLSVKIQYRKNGETEWTQAGTVPASQVTKANDAYTCEATFSGLDANASYEVQAYMQEAFETKYSNTRVVTSLPVFDWGKNDFRFRVPVYDKDGMPICSAYVSDFAERCGGTITPRFARVLVVDKAATLQLGFTCAESIEAGTAIASGTGIVPNATEEQTVMDVTNAHQLQVSADRIQAATALPAGTYVFNFPIY